MTLNITRSAMAQMGYCPSGRLFEASACGVPIVSDEWPGIGSFFMPGEEITLVKTSDDVLAALEQTDRELQDKARRARERTLAKHTGDVRAIEFESAIASVW
jgi:spore maturation protein CgeB